MRKPFNAIGCDLKPQPIMFFFSFFPPELFATPSSSAAAHSSQSFPGREEAGQHRSSESKRSCVYSRCGCRPETLQPRLQQPTATTRGTRAHAGAQVDMRADMEVADHHPSHRPTPQAARALKQTAEWPAVPPLRSRLSRLKIIRRVLGAEARASEA